MHFLSNFFEAETKDKCKLEKELQDDDQCQKSDIHDVIIPEGWCNYSYIVLLQYVFNAIEPTATRQLSSMSSVDEQLKEIETRKNKLLEEGTCISKFYD